MSPILSKLLRRAIKEALNKYEMELYEDDGMWCLMDSNYDRATVTFYPKGAKHSHLPKPGAYVGPSYW